MGNASKFCDFEVDFLTKNSSRSDPPGKAPLTRGRYVLKKKRKRKRKREKRKEKKKRERERERERERD